MYIDSSAAAKLFIDEAETRRLGTFLNDLRGRDVEIVASDLVETELRRVATREGVPQETVTGVVSRLLVAQLDRSCYTHAGILPGRFLRTLDALHLAVAIRLGCSSMISYDARQLEAARSVGLATMSP